MNYLPSKLVKLRKHYNYSQGAIAEILKVDTLEYMGYENGRLIINYEQIKKLASFYHISFYEMFLNSDDVSLNDISEDTDEINIAYFLPKRNIFQKILLYIKKHIRIFLSILGIIVIASIGILLINKHIANIPFEINKTNLKILDVSETTVVYLDKNGNVKGSGDKSHGQLDDLPHERIVKVCEGATFTIMLDETGKLHSRGLLDQHANEISSWDNIVDVAVGDGHIIAVDNRGRSFCTGDNTYKQCKLTDFNNIDKVFASQKGSIGLNKDGKLVFAGEVFGASRLKSLENIIDLDFSENNTVVLKNNGTAGYYAKNKTFSDVEVWKELVDVACGNDFIAALDKDGKVYISIDNYIIEQEVASWENIISIAAHNDYLIAYDGEKIYGIGNNIYNQFEKSPSLKITLAQVSDVSLTYENNNLVIRFKGVSNASGYLVSINAGIGLSEFVVTDQAVSFDQNNFENDKPYTLSIVSKGEGDYEDSQPLSYSFTYYNNMQNNNDDKEKFTVDVLIGKTKTNFEAYLRGLGYDISKLNGIQDETECSGEEALVTNVSGIYEGESLTIEELMSRSISFNYCKLEKNKNE